MLAYREEKLWLAFIILQHFYFREIKFEALSEYTQNLQPMVTREAYFNLLKNYNPVIPDSLDLEEPPRPALNMDKAIELAEGMYAKIVDRIQANNQKKRRKRKKRRRRFFFSKKSRLK